MAPPVKVLITDPSGASVNREVDVDDLDSFMKQMREGNQHSDPDTFGILSTDAQKFDMENTVESACDILISLEEDGNTMSSQRR